MRMHFLSRKLKERHPTRVDYKIAFIERTKTGKTNYAVSSQERASFDGRGATGRGCYWGALLPGLGAGPTGTFREFIELCTCDR